tara:strand:- start:10530 stop:12473 length:1944 start_codon:yes stop_codon:yes gene_type:complete
MKKNVVKQTVFIKLLIILMVSGTYAQNGKVKKANEDFESYSYIDARKIYLKVIEDGYESAQVYQKLGDTYYYNSEYKEASKWYKKLIEKYPDTIEPEYTYRIAQSFKSIGAYEASEKLMSSYISSSANSSIAREYKNNYNKIENTINLESKNYEVKNLTSDLSSSDFGPSFYGDKIVYASTSVNTTGDKIHDWNGLPYLDLFVTEIDKNGMLTNSIPLPGDINTSYHESSATFTKDGKTVYFTRNNFINGKKKRGKNKLISLKIFKATKKADGSWSNIKELPFNDDSYSVAHPALSIDEKRLYFSSDMPGTIGKSDLWYVDILQNGLYGSPINLGSKINTEARENFPFISENNNLYFSSDGHIGLGGLDIFVVSLDEDSKKIVNLKKPINTNLDDFGFIINETKRVGYLSSNREGVEGSISDDIYLVTENCNIIIKGIVSDKNTGELLPGSTVLLIDSDNTIVSQMKIGIDATYSFNGDIDCGMRYSVRGINKEKEYQPDEKIITTPLTSNVLKVDLALSPPDCPVNDLGCRLALQPIYFDFDKHSIRPDAEVELAKILQAMKEYPKMIIHIESHTDSRGDNSYNEILSERRAQSTLEWLVRKGIDRNRLSAKGYGESKLMNNCSDSKICSEKEHQLNRRSIFIIKN